jgi:hypothetical protein
VDKNYVDNSIVGMWITIHKIKNKSQ